MCNCGHCLRCTKHVQVVAPGEVIVYTYNVYWTGSDIAWSGRWDAYLRVSTGGAEIKLSTVFSAVMMAALLTVSAVFALLRNMRRDLAHHKIHHRPVRDGKVCAVAEVCGLNYRNLA